MTLRMQSTMAARQAGGPDGTEDTVMRVIFIPFP